MVNLKGTKTEEIQDMKYNYTVLPEYDKKEMLSMEKEMLGIYISGHPLENMRNQIETKININSLKLGKINENTEIERMFKRIIN